MNLWSFGRFELDPENRRLISDGRVLALEPKPFDVLLLLASRAGELVSKQDLLARVWAGRVVTESVLTRAVNRLRTALEDPDGRLLKTIHGFGYCLDVVVHRPAQEAAPILAEGFAPPLRPHWKLTRALPGRGSVWLAEHSKTRDLRVFKFALDPTAEQLLAREVRLHRLMQRVVKEADEAGGSLLLDWNFDLRPWFVELRYLPLGSLLDWFQRAGAQSDLATRLELVTQAAERLAAAHELGIVHADVKPANFLIESRDGGLQVRLSDLGSGGLSLSGQDLLKPALLQLTELPSAADTDASQAGTGIYQSPERLAGQPATQQGDVYSLGVMLYQFLIGDLQRPLAPGWQRDVDDPLLSADIAKAADTLPAFRHGNALAFAQDLRNLKQRREQAAASEALRQQVGLLERRRRLWRGVSAVGGVLLLSAGLFGWQLSKARDAAESAAALNQQLHQFIVSDLLGSADPYQAGGGERVTVLSVLDKARERSAEQLGSQPVLQAGVLLALGSSYRNLGKPEIALENFHAGLAALKQSVEPLPGLRADLQIGVLETLIDQSRYPEASEWLAGMPLPERSVLGAERIWRYLNAKSWLEKNAGKPIQAMLTVQPVLAETAMLSSSELAREIREIRAAALWHWGESAHQQGKWTEAEPAVREAISLFRETRGDGSPYAAWLTVSLAWIEIVQQRFDAAEALVEGMLKDAAQLSPDHLVRQYALHYRGMLHVLRGRPREAIAVFEPLLAARAAQGQQNSHLSRFAERYLVAAYQGADRLSDAERLANASLQRCREALKPAHVQCVATAVARAELWLQQGRDKDVTADLEPLLEIAEQDLPPGNLYLIDLRFALARSLRAFAPERAEQHRQAAWRGYVETLGAAHPYAGRAGKPFAVSGRATGATELDKNSRT